MTYRQAWMEAQRRCGINEETIQKCAKEADLRAGPISKHDVNKELEMRPGYTVEDLIEHLAQGMRQAMANPAETLVECLSEISESKRRNMKN